MTNFERHCKTSSHKLAKNLNTVFMSECIKRSFFFLTSSKSLNHIVDNLSTRNIKIFADIEPKMLDIANRRAPFLPKGTESPFWASSHIVYWDIIIVYKSEGNLWKLEGSRLTDEHAIPSIKG